MIEHQLVTGVHSYKTWTGEHTGLGIPFQDYGKSCRCGGVAAFLVLWYGYGS